MKFMVSGGAGFIGSHVVDRLAKDDHSVLVLDDFSTGRIENLLHHKYLTEYTGLKQSANENVIVLGCNISHPAEVLGAFIAYKPDVVIHLAAQAAISTAIADPVLDLQVNGVGTLNMLKNAMDAEVDRFVYASTSAVYGYKLLALSEGTNKCPDTYYGVSKYVGEMYCNMMDLQTTVLRFGNVYGPRQVPIGENQVIARMMRHLIQGEEFYIFGDGEQKRDFVFVEDVARAVVMAAYDKTYSMHQVYNIAGGKSYSINAVARMVAKACELPGYDWEYDKKRMDERTNVRMKIENAFAGIGWEPDTSLQVGLQKAAEWWREQ